ncbi:MAG: hypothetical protein KGI54_09280 [Pseudomonadota bacterium]|nr:hypothetical protein [Pseudomonadota bacterium]
MNHHKKGLKKLLDAVIDGQTGCLVITHKDRLLHHAIIIQIDGNSYRLKKHAVLLPQGLSHPRHSFSATHPPHHRGRPPKEKGEQQ